MLLVALALGAQAAFSSSNAFAGPNGLIVFTVGAPGEDSDLCVMGPAGTGARRLTQGPDIDLNPAWSPDGRKVAFARIPRENFFQARRLGRITFVRETGRYLSTRPELVDGEPAWSPNGKDIAATVFAQGIFVLGRNQPIARGFAPAWSPDGATILYATRSGGVRRVDPDGTNDAGVLPAPATDPDWAPSGTEIAFSQNGDIWVARSDGTQPRQLTSGVDEDSRPAWSPDGTQLVFVRRLAGLVSQRIYVVAAAGGSVARDITPRLNGVIPGDPDWQPLLGGRAATKPRARLCFYTRTGTPRGDHVEGTGEADVIFSLGGADTVHGDGGNDYIDGGGGNDVLVGGAGLDELHGRRGNDWIVSRDGRRDIVRCDRGSDTVNADWRDVVGRDCERVRRR